MPSAVDRMSGDAVRLVVGLLAAALSLGATARPETGAEPLSQCPLCIAHSGTCGCYIGFVVCCDGYNAYSCQCR